MSRLHIWKLLAVSLPLVPVVLLIVLGLRKLVGLADQWQMPLFMLFYAVGYFLFLRLLDKGWFRWLLRDVPP